MLNKVNRQMNEQVNNSPMMPAMSGVELDQVEEQAQALVARVSEHFSSARTEFETLLHANVAKSYQVRLHALLFAIVYCVGCEETAGGDGSSDDQTAFSRGEASIKASGKQRRCSSNSNSGEI